MLIVEPINPVQLDLFYRVTVRVFFYGISLMGKHQNITISEI